MAPIAYMGVTTAFWVVSLASALTYDVPCAPEHPEPGKTYPNTYNCMTDAEFNAELARFEAKDRAERKARAAKEGTFIAWLRGDDR